MLVDRAVLVSEIAQHNAEKFAEDAREFFPGRSSAAVLKLPFATRKAGGIHHPYTLAGIPYPHRLEQSHSMLIGTTGAGKTTELRSLVSQMRQRQDSAVIFDLTGAYVEAFYDPMAARPSPSGRSRPAPCSSRCASGFRSAARPPTWRSPRT